MVVSRRSLALSATLVLPSVANWGLGSQAGVVRPSGSCEWVLGRSLGTYQMLEGISKTEG